MQVLALKYDTVDAICWRHYGRTDGAVEAVLEANPGLASHGPFLPLGTPVTLPELPPPAVKPTINLWN